MYDSPNNLFSKMQAELADKFQVPNQCCTHQWHSHVGVRRNAKVLEKSICIGQKDMNEFQ
jgi:hypothetical protein